MPPITFLEPGLCAFSMTTTLSPAFAIVMAAPMPAGPAPTTMASAPVLVAAALAFASLDFGLPFLLRPDEDVMVGRAVRMVAEHSLDPMFANYPPLVFYLFALAEAVAAALGLG